MTQADSGNTSLRMSLSPDPAGYGHTCYRCSGIDRLKAVGTIEQGTGVGWTTYACGDCRVSDLVSDEPRTLDMAQLQQVRRRHLRECEHCAPELGLCPMGAKLADTIKAMADR
ncbi:hypothetical protein [Streptomyces albidoflavus]|uniref:hypothetical protein n=1 Tax=Streptomyces albidoflavus TaxID=1886 RepID=UPI0004C57BF2|nr:hypothetical protein [Streptomyces albidoflavus]